MSQTDGSSDNGRPKKGGYLSLPVLVHVLGLVTWMVGPGLVYLLSDEEYTRRHAAHAIQWSATVTYLFLGPLLIVAGVFELSPQIDVPSMRENFAVFLLYSWAGAALTVYLYAVPLLHVLVCSVGTYKAAKGTAWDYPLTVSFPSP